MTTLTPEQFPLNQEHNAVLQGTESTPATLSLCMIVRDEADLLPRFLEHAAGVWDELVVVDTGSTDATVTLLEEAGARVLHHPWQDDFAAARNVALAHAHCDWVLVLDADEFVSPALRDEIRVAIQNPQFGAATLQVHNQLSHGHRRDNTLLRLFRNVSEIRFRFPIHEEVWSSVGPYLARTGQTLTHLSGIVDHIGYVRERAAERDKKNRDLSILERCLQQDAHDLYSHYKRLELARFWSDQELWRRAAADTARILDELPTSALASAAYGGELLVLIAQGLHEGGRALMFVQARMSHVPPSVELHYFLGQEHERAGRLESAEAAYEKTREVASSQLNVQLSSARPLMGLCRIAIARNDHDQALHHCHRALAVAPRDLEALTALCELGFAKGSHAVQQAVEDHAATHGSSPELWTVYGNAAMGRHQADLAVTAYGEAYRALGNAQSGLNLGKSLVLAGEWQAAHALLGRLTDDLPEAGIGMLVCDMCLDRGSNLQLELNQEQADLFLREWMTVALAGSDSTARTNIARWAPTLEHIFPWLPGALGLASVSAS